LPFVANLATSTPGASVASVNGTTVVMSTAMRAMAGLVWNWPTRTRAMPPWPTSMTDGTVSLMRAPGMSITRRGGVETWNVL
jgi:hypothetical protein